MTTKSWVGNAAAVKDVWTVSLSGTVTSQTYLLTINGKSVQYVAGGGDSVSSILLGLQSAWNAATAGEFRDLAATALPSAGPYTSLALTGNTAGKPSTVSAATGGGASFSISNTTIATGPNFFNNGKNWSDGVAPANSDTLVFENGSSDCKYGLSTSLTGIILIIQRGYSGKIGLPKYNTDLANASYAEYRPQNLTLAGGTVTIQAPSIQRCHLAFGANEAHVRVLETNSTRIDQYTPIVLITGGDSSSDLDITKGDVGLAYYEGNTAEFPIVRMSFKTQTATDAKLACGAGATLDVITKNGGALTVNSDVTTLTQTATGGTLVIGAGKIYTLHVQGGTAAYNSDGALGTATVSNAAILDFDQDPRAKTVTNPIQVYGDTAKVKDNQKVVNSGVLLVTTNQTTKLNIEHGSGNVLSLT